MNNTLKKILIVACILFVAFYVYTKVTASKEKDTVIVNNGLVTSSGPNVPSTTVSKPGTIDKLLNLLLGINNIKISNAFFQKPEFLSLKDLSLKDENRNLDLSFGRKNPFLPIGSYDTISTQEIPIEAELPVLIKTSPVTAITSTNVVLNAENLTVPLTKENYFEWGVSESKLDQKTIPAKIGNTFTTTLDSLLPETTYFYRAAIKTKEGKIILGTTVSFKTLKK